MVGALGLHADSAYLLRKRQALRSKSEVKNQKLERISICTQCLHQTDSWVTHQWGGGANWEDLPLQIHACNKWNKAAKMVKLVSCCCRLVHPHQEHRHSGGASGRGEFLPVPGPGADHLYLEVSHHENSVPTRHRAVSQHLYSRR